MLLARRTSTRARLVPTVDATPMLTPPTISRNCRLSAFARSRRRSAAHSCSVRATNSVGEKPPSFEQSGSRLRVECRSQNKMPCSIKYIIILLYTINTPQPHFHLETYSDLSFYKKQPFDLCQPPPLAESAACRLHIDWVQQGGGTGLG